MLCPCVSLIVAVIDEDDDGSDGAPLRDPRRENTVVNEELTPAERAKNLQELARDDFADRTPARLESVETGRLYLVEIAEAEHGVRLGLATAMDVVEKDAEGFDLFEIGWFVMTSKAGWKAKNPAFKKHEQRNGRRQTDKVTVRSFRLLVEDCDLTPAGLADKETHPKFRREFALKVMCFARAEKLDADHDTEDELSVDDDGGEEDEDEDGEGGLGGDEAMCDDCAEEDEGEDEEEEEDEDGDGEEDAEDSPIEEEEPEPEPEQPRKRRGSASTSAGERSGKRPAASKQVTSAPKPAAKPAAKSAAAPVRASGSGSAPKPAARPRAARPRGGR